MAGNGAEGFGGDGSPATDALLNDPYGVFVDESDNIFIAELINSRICRVDSTTGIITTVAGNGETSFSGDGSSALDASLNSPRGIFIDDSNNIFIADTSNHRIRMVDSETSIIITVTGNGIGNFMGDGGSALDASLNFPTSVFVDNSNNIYQTRRMTAYVWWMKQPV